MNKLICLDNMVKHWLLCMPSFILSAIYKHMLNNLKMKGTEEEFYLHVMNWKKQYFFNINMVGLSIFISFSRDYFCFKRSSQALGFLQKKKSEFSIHWYFFKMFSITKQPSSKLTPWASYQAVLCTPKYPLPSWSCAWNLSL